MILRVIVFLTLLLGWATAQGSTDWPTHGGDSGRSRSTSVPLHQSLHPTWKWVSPQPPSPAWEGPAKRDAYNKVLNLEARLFFDRAFGLVSADGMVFFGSSSDDQLRCLDVSSGQVKWSFFAGGPIRLAPTYYEGRVFVGSDDGFVYCVDASNGKLIWKSRLGPSERTVIGSGRIVSVWPVRTGLVVEDGLIHVACGLFPSEGSWLVTLSAIDGAVVWKHEVPNLSPQGYIMASKDRIVLPASRSAPYVFERSTGKLLYSVGGHGGTFAVLSKGRLVCGPGKTGQLSAFNERSKSPIATLSANRLSVSGEFAYLQSDRHLEKIDFDGTLQYATEMVAVRGEQKKAATRLKAIGALIKAGVRKKDEQTEPIPKEELAALAKEKQLVTEQLVTIGSQIDAIATKQRECREWRVPSDEALSVITVGDRIVTGGRGSVAIRDSKTGQIIEQHKVDGDAWDLISVDGRLLISTSRGVIYSLGSKEKGVR